MSLLIKSRIEIAQLVLKIIRGNLAVSVIATAISLVIDQFKDAYECHGPVMLDPVHYSKEALQSMQINQPYCDTRTYEYETQGGCIKDDPINLNSKFSKYIAEHCVQRYEGESTGSGEVNVDHPRSAGPRVEPHIQLVTSVTSILMLMWLNA